ncbi:SUMF1/EgtB/PvdO family nonheme iron enzyme [Kitasatospora sp. SUK 42]|uniref:nSTAND1 domain-containing NTPase n=1 Tax=Kitasatospora sp. SUK 42 TaxID=1588882 RepID=UPI0018C8DE93|nr:SUMF1/EgtB/PvdO family nonheme iron enzyme [Kitasatospora sp. SUK 42]MBV2154746.1 SUMF1/EgtB/PvdO family nonheme iron enzyme [Kitasatospora sp. SUK 42]
MRHIRVFLSSPSDVREERAALRKVISDLPYDAFLRGLVEMEEISWDRPGAGVPLFASLPPQEAVNRGLPRPSECDIVVIVLWSRMGTPPHVPAFSDDDRAYRSGTEWEFFDAVQAERRTGRPKVLLYKRTADLFVSLKDPEFEQKRSQQELVDAFVAEITDAANGIPVGVNQYADLSEFRPLVENHLRLIVKEIMDEELTLEAGSRSRRDFSLSPFPGLRPFTDEESLVFFGREHETSEIIQRLGDQRHRFLAVIGASGIGKSSLVNAGVMPALRAGAIPGAESWRSLRFTPAEIEGNPFLALAAQLSEHGRAPWTATPEVAARELEADAAAVGRYIDEALAGAPSWARLLVVVDQFEELFGSGVEEERRARFVGLLTEMVAAERALVVVTLRADFYAHCLNHPRLAELLRSGSFPLGGVGLGALYRMITRPAEIAGLQYEGDLAERILEDAGAEPGSLALMAFALNTVSQHASPEGLLLLSEYERIGGIRGAVATRAEEIFDELAETDREQLPALFRKLTDVSESDAPVRRRAKLSGLTADPSTARLVDLLVRARLLVVSDDEYREPTVEVAHEALFGSWPRLAEWIQQTQDDLTLLRQLRRAAVDWVKADRPASFLWPHERLVLVEAMLRNLDPELDPEIEKFIVPEAARILAETTDAATTHQRRASLGDRLWEIGDPRPGVGLDADGLPEIQWCEVPGGSVRLRDVGEIEVPGFRLAAYPVTYRQYRAFLDDPGGFADPRWFEGLAVRPEAPGSQFRKLGNHPAENVSWYDAVAFCRWFSARTGTEVRLPADWEWQLAVAGSGDGGGYAWGGAWEDERANLLESGLGRTVAVGLYPDGATAAGVHDLHGNIWEWCLNLLSDASVNGTDQGSTSARVVRGGSWLVSRSFARATFRGWDDPELRYPALGFRLLRAA